MFLNLDKLIACLFTFSNCFTQDFNAEIISLAFKEKMKARQQAD